MQRDGSDAWRQRLQVETRPASGQQDLVDLRVPGLTILYHPDACRVGERATLTELAAGKQSLLSRLEPLFAAPGDTIRRPLAEHHLSRKPIHLAPTAEDGARLHYAASPTRVVVDGAPVPEGRMFSARDLRQGVVLLLGNRVVLLLHMLQPVPDHDVPHYGLIGESATILRLRREIGQLADLDVSVLLRGETGTGKELVARALHKAGVRRARPYLAVNMAAIPPSLAAAELFGVARGAFTGADRKRPGYFRQAHGGTLFLDEIGEVPPEVQPLLLRALENGEIQPVGVEEPLEVDVRIIAATDSNLEAEIEAGHFRAPLLHRLSGYELHISPLRERREDIGRLLFHFLRRELEALGEARLLEDPGLDGRPWLPASLVARLAVQPWLGNVRQLYNVARHLVISSRGASAARIGTQIEGLLEFTGWRKAPDPGRPSKPAYRSPKEVSEDELVSALRDNRWHLGATARQLGISRASLYLLVDDCPRTRKAADLSRQEIKASIESCNGDLDTMVEVLEVSKDGLKRRMRQLGMA